MPFAQDTVDNNIENTLQHSLGPFLVLAQCFGVLPVCGVWPTANVASVRFPRCCTPALLLTCSLVGFSLLDFFLSIKVVLERGLRLYTVGPLSFSIICLIAYLVFLLLACHWPALALATRRLECIFLQPCYTNDAAPRFSQRLRRLGGTLLCAAVVEHLSYVSSAIYGNHLQIQDCNITMDFWQSYYVRESWQLFSIVSYNVWLIPLVEWITIAFTFVWNFVDIFLILVCQALTIRFRQLHWRLQRHAHQRMPMDFWLEMRQHLLAFTDLVRLYDKRLSALVLLACAHNMYFICVQVYHSFQHKGNFMNEIYFWCSLVYVLARFLTMMFSAAAIPDAANEISLTLYEIPTDHWCIELKRLHEILLSENLALSGSGFFYLTRRLIIAMAGTIVVYELVLIDQIHEAKDGIDRCSRAALMRTF